MLTYFQVDNIYLYNLSNIIELFLKDFFFLNSKIYYNDKRLGKNVFNLKVTLLLKRNMKYSFYKNNNNNWDILGLNKREKPYWILKSIVKLF